MADWIDGRKLDGVPDHVPHDLVFPFDLTSRPIIGQCPFIATMQEKPDKRIFWNPTNPRFGGSWTLTRAEDMRFVLNTPDLFSSQEQASYSDLAGESWPLIPLELDPPRQAEFRKLMNPFFSPKSIASLLPGVKARSTALIDQIEGERTCEFMSAFGRPFPVGVFLELMGLSEDMAAQFLEWEHGLLHDPDLNVKASVAKSIAEYLRGLARERKDVPTDDLISAIVHSKIDGRPLSDDEIIGMLFLLYIGGLDSVGSSLGFFFWHLATHKDDQQFLRNNPDRIPSAIEELLRRFSIVTSSRRCKEDLELAGVPLKKGDWITVNHAFASLDDREHVAPLEVDFARTGVRHLAFAYGPHFCVGSQLARRELQTALQQWLERIPAWRVKEGSEVRFHGAGSAYGVDQLELEW